jgi:hypothetical protein
MKASKKQNVDAPLSDLIVYHAVEEKNKLEHQMRQPMTPEQSLILTLNMMDFMAVLRPQHARDDEDQIPWIILELPGK